MIQSTNIASHPVLQELHDALEHVVTALAQKWEDLPLRLRPVHSPARTDREEVFKLEGLDEIDLRVRFASYPLGDGTYEVYVGLDEGPTCRFTCDATGDAAEKEKERARLGRKVTAVLLREIEPHIGRVAGSDRASTEETERLSPVLVLDREGAIIRMNEAARELLDIGDGATINPNFFSHVHGQNLPCVFRDLARMVNQDIQRARWLLRLQMGRARWRWYRTEVLNRLETDGTIRIFLRGLERRTEHV